MLVHPYPFTEEIKKLYATNIFPKQEGYKYLFLSLKEGGFKKKVEVVHVEFSGKEGRL